MEYCILLGRGEARRSRAGRSPCDAVPAMYWHFKTSALASVLACAIDPASLLVAGSSQSGHSIGPRLPDHFSFFHDDLAATSSFSTFAFGATNVSTVVSIYEAHGLPSMWNLEGDPSQPGGSVLWTRTAPACRAGCRNNATHCPSPLCVLALRTDWERRWTQVAAQAAPLLNSGKLIGFWLGDELYHQGVLPAELDLVASAVRLRHHRHLFRFPLHLSWRTPTTQSVTLSFRAVVCGVVDTRAVSLGHHVEQHVWAIHRLRPPNYRPRSISTNMGLYGHLRSHN